MAEAYQWTSADNFKERQNKLLARHQIRKLIQNKNCTVKHTIIENPYPTAVLYNSRPYFITRIELVNNCKPVYVSIHKNKGFEPDIELFVGQSSPLLIPLLTSVLYEHKCCSENFTELNF